MKNQVQSVAMRGTVKKHPSKIYRDCEYERRGTKYIVTQGPISLKAVTFVSVASLKANIDNVLENSN